MSLDDFLILSRDSSDISLCDSDSESELEDAVLLHRRAAQSNLITSTISDGEDGNDEALLHAILEGSCSHGDLCVNNVVTAVGPVTRPVSDQSDKHFTPSPTEVSALRWLNPTISSFLLPSAARSVTIPAHSDVELDILEEGAPQLLEEERNLFAERLLNAGQLDTSSSQNQCHFTLSIVVNYLKIVPLTGTSSHYLSHDSIAIYRPLCRREYLPSGDQTQANKQCSQRHKGPSESAS